MLQIPASRSQNKPSRILWVLRLHASRDKLLRRAGGFLASDFRINVCEFKFPPITRVWDVPDFSFLDSRFKTHDGRGVEITDFSSQLSRFTFPASTRRSHTTNPTAFRFSFRDSRFKIVPPSLSSRARTFLIYGFPFQFAHKSVELCIVCGRETS